MSAPSSTSSPQPQNLDQLNANIERLTQAVEQDNAAREREAEGKKANSQSSSRVALAAALALVGAKTAGILGALVGHAKAAVEPETRALMKRSQKEAMAIIVSEGVRYGSITAAIGAAAGGVLGWVRGDRVKDAGDIIKHPIDTLGRVLGPRPKDMDEKPTPAPASVTESPARTGQWTDRVSASPAPSAATESTPSDNDRSWEQRAAANTQNAAQAAAAR